MSGQWDRAAIHDLADEILGHHAREGRIDFGGATIMLPARQAIALSMAFYELMTNAFKHGALSSSPGRVELSWRIETEGSRIRIEWREVDGPPVITPERKGFGTFLIDRALAAEMNGSVAMNYGAMGYSWTLDAPLPAQEGPGSQK